MLHSDMALKQVTLPLPVLVCGANNSILFTFQGHWFKIN